MRKFTLIGLVLIVLFAASSNVASAQVSASITGRVEDASSAAIPDVTITVTNRETGTARTVLTGTDGNYRVLSLPVGPYEVKAEKPGFKAGVQAGIELVVGQQAVVNLKLEIGEVQQSVTVTSEGPVVNTTTASVSGLVGQAEVKDLPLNGRSLDNLITLNPGATNYTSHTSTAAVGAGSGNQFEVDGRRPSENLFLLNGVEYTANSVKEVTPGGASGELLGIDGIREFNLLSDTYSAQYGKRPGAQVAVVTQSGANQIHGTVFEFLRNSALDARNFFDHPQGERIPPFERNQFGASVGGPIRKDKVFIFGNYEGFRQRLGISDVAIVPDDDARQGLLPNSQGVPTLVTGLKTGMLPFFQLWPEPNGPELGGGLALSYSSPLQSVREDYGTIRVDENLSASDSLSEIYTVSDGYNNDPQANRLFIGLLDQRAQVASLQETHIFSPEMINTFRFGFSRGAFTFNVPPVIAVPPSLSMFAGLEPGAMSFGASVSLSNQGGSVTSVGSTDNYQQGVRNLFTYTDDFQLVKGKHQISFGAWFQRLQNNSQGAARKAGQATFSSLQTFLQGTVSSFIGTPDPSEAGYRMLMGAWYVEDNITLRRNLNLRIGLRHEFTNGWSEVDGRIGGFVFASPGVLATNPIVGKVVTQNNAKWLFGPRIGLAWDVFGNGKTAIRSAFGTHYYLQDSLGWMYDKTPPFNAQVSFGSNTPFLPLIPVQPGVSGPPPCGPGVPLPCTTLIPTGPTSTLKTPTVEEWNLSVEQQITPSTVLRVAYVGSHGYHEVVGVDLNSIPPEICSDPAGCVSGGINSAHGFVTQGTLYVPVTPTRPNPYLASATMDNSIGNSSYNALQVDVTHRLSKGLQFRANYTWSRNLDEDTETGSSQATNGPGDLYNSYNPKLDWGPATTDATHMASISSIYDLPIGRGKAWLSGVGGITDRLVSGWQMNSIVTLMSGLPFTPLVAGDQSGDGNTGTQDRPSWNTALSGPIITGNPNQWFNPQAFILPMSGTFGNVGRSSLRGPGLATLDMSLFKNTSLTERFRLQFRAEVFNILNHANFNPPNATVFSGGVISPSAGLITTTATTSRQIQFGLKLIF